MDIAQGLLENLFGNHCCDPLILNFVFAVLFYIRIKSAAKKIISTGFTLLDFGENGIELVIGNIQDILTNILAIQSSSLPRLVRLVYHELCNLATSGIYSLVLRLL